MLTGLWTLAIAALALLGAWLVLKRECTDIRREFRQEVSLLRARIQQAEQLVAASHPRESPRHSQTRGAEHKADAANRTEDISPATRALIEETVTGFLGKKARIRSIRKVAPGSQSVPLTASTSMEAWTQQGRVLVQGSHDSVQARTSGALHDE